MQRRSTVLAPAQARSSATPGELCPGEGAARIVGAGGLCICNSLFRGLSWPFPADCKLLVERLGKVPGHSTTAK
ncbi:MAG: hypothetical protein OXU61_05840 [Gammaproteobacteria bacterium]|nr:hypothetical protein [Gammaproteobacteria bacterium]